MDIISYRGDMTARQILDIDILVPTFGSRLWNSTLDILPTLDKSSILPRESTIGTRIRRKTSDSDGIHAQHLTPCATLRTRPFSRTANERPDDWGSYTISKLTTAIINKIYRGTTTYLSTKKIHQTRSTDPVVRTFQKLRTRKTTQNIASCKPALL